MIDYRAAKPGEAEALTELVLKSKAHWGYDQAFMDACRDELTITEEMIQSAEMRVAAVETGPLAMAQLDCNGESASLDKLFVHPDWFGRGIGKALFGWAAETAAKAGARSMTIDADPDAVPFYRGLGAVEDSFVPSGSIEGRVLPRLHYMIPC